MACKESMKYFKGIEKQNNQLNICSGGQYYSTSMKTCQTILTPTPLCWRLDPTNGKCLVCEPDYTLTGTTCIYTGPPMCNDPQAFLCQNSYVYDE
jgi:hypothetical protein